MSGEIAEVPVEVVQAAVETMEPAVEAATEAASGVTATAAETAPSVLEPLAETATGAAPELAAAGMPAVEDGSAAVVNGGVEDVAEIPVDGIGGATENGGETTAMEFQGEPNGEQEVSAREPGADETAVTQELVGVTDQAVEDAGTEVVSSDPKVVEKLEDVRDQLSDEMATTAPAESHKLKTAYELAEEKLVAMAKEEPGVQTEASAESAPVEGEASKGETGETTSVAEEPVAVEEVVSAEGEQETEKQWKPTRRARGSEEYQQAMERLTAEAKQNGEDITNPKVQERLQKQASDEFHRAYSEKNWRRELTDEVRKRSEFTDAYDRALAAMKANLKPGERINDDELLIIAFAQYVEAWDRRPLRKKAVGVLKEMLKIMAAFLFGSSTETQRKLQEQPGGRR